MINPMTDAQRRLAEENHDLVYAFLEENNLSVNQYYDVVIFGYLCAVQEYCEKPSLRKYKFATVAWKKMLCELKDYQRYISSKKNSYTTVSLNDYVSEGSDLRWEDVLFEPDDILEQLHADLILHDLAARLPRREMRIIRMKLRGDKMHDIAKAERLTFREINRLLDGAYNTVVEVLWR